MKKISIIFILLFLLSACGNNQPVMDRPADDGNYYYSNKGLGFSFTLPPEFIYYQTQRKETENYTDLEIFVPTTDKIIAQVVPDYAKPIVVRIFNNDYWQTIDKTDGIFIKMGEKGDKVYTLMFWDEVPTDWLDRWNEELKEKLKNNFKIL